MKQGSTLFLKIAVIFLGAAALALCVFVLPATIGEISMDGYDPILLGMYVPAVPFFFALYQAMKLLNYIDKKKAFSELSVESLRSIKYCAAMIALIYAAGLPYIYRVADLDDAPGVVAIALVIIFASVIISAFAALLQKLLREALDIKSENELTV